MKASVVLLTVLGFVIFSEQGHYKSQHGSKRDLTEFSLSETFENNERTGQLETVFGPPSFSEEDSSKESQGDSKKGRGRGRGRGKGKGKGKGKDKWNNKPGKGNTGDSESLSASNYDSN